MTASAAGELIAPDGIDAPADLARTLVAWHAAHQRDLPWRTTRAGTRDPYTVLVSEIMLQQTRVEVVVDYFRRWMARFPTLAALAAADQDAVLKQWEGLGYYARARNLHRAAQALVAQHGGTFPQSRAALLALPGIGRYSAGAILSLAFGQAEPLLDGNVTRVLTRLADIAAPIEATATRNRLWAMATALVMAADAGDAGMFNEALMELGATTCTPRSPRCLLCPVAASCRAQIAGTQEQRPVRMPKKATPHYEVAAGVIWQGQPGQSHLLLAQRPADGLLGGLWEFPGGKREPEDADLPATLRREIREELAIEILVGEPIVVVPHAFTHFRITLHAFHASHHSGEPQAIGCAA
ncbi:MAG: A/G-specific adenine glycosylase, partial [Caldilineaceae bacterium]